MNIQGKLVIDPAFDVEVPYHGKDGTYEAYILKYVDDRGQVKELIKPMSSLKYKKTMEATMRELKKGDEVTITIEKNAKGFNDVQSVQKGKQDLPADGTNATRTPVSASGGSSPAQRVGSTYETPDERKVKQRLIVRQAALNQAVELVKLANPKGAAVDVAEVANLAEGFENWVYRGME